MEERRRATPPTEVSGYLRALPALLLLDRIPTAMLGVGLTGDIVYANPACADMLGHADAEAVPRLHLPELLVGHLDRSPGDCVASLRFAESIVSWNHADGHVIRTTVSAPLLLRKSDPLVLIGMMDVTDWLWAGGSC
ncbi:MULTISPECIES: PAS domain-containing protein [unclassified Mycobacterium]|uniref:PAS domain-containing protein n=1 Tax=unclassified Mycobacterium TaxID=2642494 RepID=UPI0029C8BEDC|nr:MULTISPECIES: PAS domain-containing protein [unclassified Mycobacterium]